MKYILTTTKDILIALRKTDDEEPTPSSRKPMPCAQKKQSLDSQLMYTQFYSGKEITAF